MLLRLKVVLLLTAVQSFHQKGVVFINFELEVLNARFLKISYTCRSVKESLAYLIRSWLGFLSFP